MGFYGEQVLPRLIDFIMSQEEFARLRRSVLSELRGTVLEIGIGSGLSLSGYPPAVRKILAIEPSQAAQKIASRRAEELGIPLEFTDLEAEKISLPDASVDCVVSTWTLCTIPHLQKALSEIRRVLKPGGVFHFVEHGISPDPKIARWQDRLTPLQRKIAGGCHLNRKIDEEISQAGFRISALEKFYIRGPKIATYQYLGKAGVSTKEAEHV
jgi:ubiquinone/menaquinone biosynthesis C-methylase UbiE